MNKKGKIAIIVASSVALLAGGGTALYFFVFKNKVDVVTEIKLARQEFLGGKAFLNKLTNIKKGNKYKLVVEDLSIAFEGTSTTFDNANFIFTTSDSTATTSYPNIQDTYDIGKICDSKFLGDIKTSNGDGIACYQGSYTPGKNQVTFDTVKFYGKFGQSTFSDSIKGFTWEFTAATTIDKIVFKVGLLNN